MGSQAYPFSIKQAQGLALAAKTYRDQLAVRLEGLGVVSDPLPTTPTAGDALRTANLITFHQYHELFRHLKAQGVMSGLVSIYYWEQRLAVALGVSYSDLRNDYAQGDRLDAALRALLTDLDTLPPIEMAPAPVPSKSHKKKTVTK